MTSSSTTGRLLTTWNRRDWWQAAALLGFIGLLHVVGFGMLFALVAPHHYAVGTQVFGVGLGITAYVYGMRHAFDADHIAAIDNTTRKLRADGRRPKAVGFWFAMGHSFMVFLLAVLVAVGAKAATSLTDDRSTAHQVLSVLGTLSSGTFLYLIGVLNLVALVGIVRIFLDLRRGVLDESELEQHLQNRGFFSRLFNTAAKAITRPIQMFGIGVLFGLGFDTATEVALLVLAGTGAAAGLPWYALIVLPLLFACGMSLLDCLDGLFMSVAYDWAFLRPVRKVYYNMAVTALSVLVALLIGTIELVAVMHDDFGWHGPVVDRISAVNLNNVGFIVVGLFVLVWGAAITYWKVGKVEERWGGSAPV